MAYYGPWKQALELGALKRAKKQIEALNLLLTQDLEKGNEWNQFRNLVSP